MHPLLPAPATASLPPTHPALEQGYDSFASTASTASSLGGGSAEDYGGVDSNAQTMMATRNSKAAVLREKCQALLGGVFNDVYSYLRRVRTSPTSSSVGECWGAVH